MEGVSRTAHVDTAAVLPGGMSYEQIFAQTSPYHTTVYIGNLPHGITRKCLIFIAAFVNSAASTVRAHLTRS